MLEYTKKRFHVEQIILILLLIFSMSGIWIMNFSPADGYGYWTCLVAVFAIFSIILGWKKSKHNGDEMKSILREQFIHWTSSLFVTIGAFLILESGKVIAEDTGIIILLILSLSTILDGLRVGWRFGLVGVFLGVAAVISAYTPNFLWIELAIASLIIIFTSLFKVFFK